MNYNLTEKQKELARWIVKMIREKKLAETFGGYGGGGQMGFYSEAANNVDDVPGNFSMLRCLSEEELLSLTGNFSQFSCAIKGKTL